MVTAIWKRYRGVSEKKGLRPLRFGNGTVTGYIYSTASTPGCQVRDVMFRQIALRHPLPMLQPRRLKTCPRCAALVVAALLLGAGVPSAQPDIVDRFQKRSFEGRGLVVSYGLFVPEDYDPSVAYPLVLALHGAGERGSDYRHLGPHRLATSWADPTRQADHPAFVLVPQVPSGLRWTTDQDPDDTDFVPIELATLDILDAIEAEFTIDPDRVYAVGLSLGGHATWDFVSRLPGRFAAAVPMSGRGFTSQADDLGDLPIWAFTGETDTVVPPSQTRRVVQALEDLGRQVIYTDCRRAPVEARAFDCPGRIAQDSLAEAIDAHARLIYTSEPQTGHGPWAPWFDHPLLADWLFSKVRLDAEAVAVTSPTADARVSGFATVTWTSPRDDRETVEVWLSRNAGRDWSQVGTATVGDGQFVLPAVADTPTALVRLFVLNAQGRVAGVSTSGFFAIDNPGDASPTLRIDDEAVRFADAVTARTLDLPLLAADPEGQPLTATIRYSADGGASFSDVETVALTSRPEFQPVAVALSALPNTARAVLAVTLSDGTHTVTAQTAVFAKTTPRPSGLPATRVEGDGEGSVAVRVVDPDALTGHRYRVTFAVLGDGTKAYSVTNLDDGRTVLRDTPFSDGVSESAVFDGLALVVEDPAEGSASAATGWTVGDTDLDVAVSGGTVRLGILTLTLLATEDDYTFTMTDAVVGRSVERYRIPEQDLRFRVTAASDGAARSVVFDDLDDDGRPGPGDTLFLLDRGPDGTAAPSWRLQFTGGTEPPETGDVFELVPVRSLGPGDAFEFRGMAVAAEPPTDSRSDLTGFPNPFGDRLEVSYQLDRPGQVTLDVYDALGRRVARLAEGPIGPGLQRAVWDSRGASGVFVLRLTGHHDDGTPVALSRRVTRIPH